MNIENFIRTIDNFPKSGIKFKDITPLLNNHEAMNHCLELLISDLENKKIDKVIGVESRGFFFWNLNCSKIKCWFCACT